MKKMIKYYLGILFTIVGLSSFSQTSCMDTMLVGERTNLGLYGGLINDLDYSKKKDRLFGAYSAPQSVFISDNKGDNWYPAFPFDSLGNECSSDGWGGGALTIQSNNRGWVATNILELAGDHQTVLISFLDGDTNSWKTAINLYTLIALGINEQSFTDIYLTDSSLFVATSRHIIKVDSGSVLSNTILFNIDTFPSSNHIRNIEVVRTADSVQIFMMITQNSSTNSGLLYKWNYDTLISIPLPTQVPVIDNVFLPGLSASGDTLFISGEDTTTQVTRIYSSFDGGLSWNDVHWGELKAVEYVSLWKSFFPSSNGIVLFKNYGADSYYSVDLGTNWLPMKVFNPIADYPLFMAFAISTTEKVAYAARGEGTYRSTSLSATTNAFSLNENIDLEAIHVRQIAHAADKSIVYLATSGGLAYTTAYYDNSVVGNNKWKYPYGKFPIEETDDNLGQSCVVIDPSNPNHVIAGGNGVFYYTLNGPDNFSTYSPYKGQVKDIVIVDSMLAFAVSGANNMGEIWKTIDGGVNWSTISPSGFCCGNTIAMGKNSLDTVLYVGTGYNNSIPGNLYRSDDLGNVWQFVNTGPTNVNNNSIQNLIINEIEVYPGSIDTLYMAAGFDTTMALVYSYDKGITYQYTSAKTPKHCRALALYFDNPDSNLFFSSANDLYYYNPAVDTLSLIVAGLPGELIDNISFGSVLAGTSTGFYSIGFDPIDDDIVTTIPSKISHSPFSIFPNPAYTILYVHSEYIRNTTAIIEIYDLLGNRVNTFSHVFNTESKYAINIEKLPQGSYLLHVVSEKEVLNYQFIVLK